MRVKEGRYYRLLRFDLPAQHYGINRWKEQPYNLSRFKALLRPCVLCVFCLQMSMKKLWKVCAIKMTLSLSTQRLTKWFPWVEMQKDCPEYLAGIGHHSQIRGYPCDDCWNDSIHFKYMWVQNFEVSAVKMGSIISYPKTVLSLVTENNSIVLSF